ncbi:MAG TPA: hypothetical protein VGS57_14750 [Thermoanaerobaculia bacterium]|nr:hypothetical protein [Thermoanaerobaculia bacterium]
MILVILLLAIPAGWIYLFHSHWVRRKTADTEDILHWLTAISVPYLILGFAMILEFRAVIEDPAAGVGAIAAIMVLYALSILASFLYLEVRDLKKTFAEKVAESTAKVAEASKWYSYSLALSSAEDGQPSPGASIEQLLASWQSIYACELPRTGGATAQKVKLRRNAIGTLLSTYMKEEAESASGSMSLDRVPESVWPWAGESDANTNREGVSFLITNVGYYAKLLRAVSHFLPGAADEPSGVFLATITYALPPLWWNWQAPAGDAYIYPPVEQFRDTLHSLAGDVNHGPRRARVFRKVIVADGWVDPSLFSRDDWERMAQWQLALHRDRQTPISSYMRSLPVEYYDAVSKTGNLVKELQWTGGRPTTDGRRRGRHAYWMLDENARPLRDSDLDLVGVWEYFADYMHPRKQGYTDIVGIPQEVFASPVFDKNSPGLSGCGELLFFGVSDPDSADAWTEQKEPELALAVLTTMSPSSETLFVTAVWGEARLYELWDAIRCVVGRFSPPIATTA